MSRAGASPERSAASPDVEDADRVDSPLTASSSDSDNGGGHAIHHVGLASQHAGHRHHDMSQHRLRRRVTRAGTVHIVDNFVEQLDDRPGWRPGSEPGIDVSKPDGGHGSMVNLRAKCQITVVDFSEDNIAIHELDNDEMIAFLKIPQPAWVKCRWINVNALSWDVIQALGQYKQLHSLAIEDLMNTGNRTKADWYHNHAFLILTLQKLVRIVDPKKETRETSSERSTTGLLRKMTGLGRSKDDDFPEDGIESGVYPRRPNASFGRQPSGITITEVTDKHSLRTLQSFHASPNATRTEYMEKHSALAKRNLAAVAEQVSIFITSDNTVIAFFENSADDVEVPILTRLNSPSTILRQSCDASMVAQAIIDVIIDMAIPVQVAYADVIGDIELDVLTRPNIQQSKDLYIISSEISKMRSFIQPIVTVINALRDHKIVVSGSGSGSAGPSTHQTREYSPGKDDLRDPSKGVIISPLTYVYLGDALDHCVLINENLLQIAKAADNMIDLIFNTIAARQNEVLQLLTNVTIVFLPMTFLTGYFGQNFQPFPELDQGITLFWKIAIPLMVGTIVVVMSPQIIDYARTVTQRRRIGSMRRRLRERRGKAA